MNNSSISQATVQDPILATYEEQAAHIAQYYQSKLQEANKAHRRERYIIWHEYYDSNGEGWDMVVADYAMCGCEPPVDGISCDEENEIVGRHYDRLTDDEKSDFDKMLRRERSEDYLDDYYRDELIAIREEWNHLIHKLESPGNEYNTQTFVVKAKYSPGVFHCLVCGTFSYSHDEAGQLIAGAGLWTMSDGELGNYMVCECCKEKPSETNKALARYFAECEAYHKAHDEAIDLASYKLPDRSHDEWTQDEKAEFQKFIDDYTAMRLAASMADYDARDGQTNNATGNSTGSQPAVFPILTLKEFLLKPKKIYLIDKIIARGEIGMTFGPPGEGKTFAALDKAISACLGEKWAGQFNIPKPLTVVYAYGEGGEGLPDRLKSAMESRGITDVPNLFIIPVVPQLFEKTRQDAVEVLANELVAAQTAGAMPAIDLVIIDTQHTAIVNADENSSKDMGIVFDNIRNSLIKRLDCAVELIHHTVRDGTRFRGSSGILGGVSVMMKVYGNGTYHLECEKLKDGDKWQPLTFSLIAKGDSVYPLWSTNTSSGGDARHSDDRQEIIDLLLAGQGKSYTAKEITDGIGSQSQPNVRAILKNLGRDKIVETVDYGDGKKPRWGYQINDAWAAVQGMVNNH